MRVQHIFIIAIICVLCFESSTQKQFRKGTESIKDFVYNASFDATKFLTNQMQQPLQFNRSYYAGNIPIGTSPFYPNDTVGSNSTIFYQLQSANNSAIINQQASDKTKPLILWLQGGPGCSSWYGELEFGSYKVVNTSNSSGNYYSLVENTYTWAVDNYLLFVDNPIGVGYSTVVGNETGQVPMTITAQQAAINLENFLVQFFAIYKEMLAHPFYIMGESFGGHYVPALTSLILSNPNSPINNLVGMGIGDGWTDPYNQLNDYASYFYSVGIISTFRMERYRNIQGGTTEDILNQNWQYATGGFNVFTDGDGPEAADIITFDVNQLNYRQYGQASDDSNNLQAWLNLDSTIAGFNVPPTLAGTVQLCVNDIYYAFVVDVAQSYAGNFTIILSNSTFKVLLYEGQNDATIPVNGAQAWLNNLSDSLVEGWRNTPKRHFYLASDVMNPKPAGWYKKYGNFNFVFVNNAGHMVPTDQPKVAATMLKDFLNDKFK